MSITGTDFDQYSDTALDSVAKQLGTMPNPPIHPNVFKLVARYGAMQQRSAEWFAKRQRMLTASDVAAAIDANPYCTRHELLYRKLAPLSVEQTFNKQARAAIAHGEKYEDEAAREYFRRYPQNGTLYSCGLIPHPEHSFLGGSPDRITANGILIEIKVREFSATVAECGAPVLNDGCSRWRAGHSR